MTRTSFSASDRSHLIKSQLRVKPNKQSIKIKLKHGTFYLESVLSNHSEARAKITLFPDGTRVSDELDFLALDSDILV